MEKQLFARLLCEVQFFVKARHPLEVYSEISLAERGLFRLMVSQLGFWQGHNVTL
jgi:hypothetical protein